MTGDIKKPVLAMHTASDELIPVDLTIHYQELTNERKTTDQLVQLYVNRAGHCSFALSELGGSLTLLDSWIREGKRPQPGDFTNGQHTPNDTCKNCRP